MRTFAITALLVAAACASSSTGGARTITVDIAGTRFIPDTFTVRAGETVRFEIVNKDIIEHEFLIGDEETQESHTPGEHAHAGGQLSLKAKASGTLTYTFPDDATTLIVGCHVDDHYETGMKGTITVTS